MNSNSEIRKEASALAKTKWFWRLLVITAVLGLLPQVTGRLLGGAFTASGIQSWSDFFSAWLEAQRSGLGYSVPSMRMAGLMTGASLFSSFIVYIFSAIAMLGLAIASLGAIRNREQGWFRSSFDGFAKPLELAWLLALMNLKIFLWSLLFFFPGIIAMYRYRQAWYLKSDHPDWSARQCLAESGRLMKGNKYQAFALDMGYAVRLLLAGIMVAAAMTAGGGSESFWLSALTLVLTFLGFWWMLRLVVKFMLARTLFYRETVAVREITTDAAVAVSA